jgi:hypothetical protein
MTLVRNVNDVCRRHHRRRHVHILWFTFITAILLALLIAPPKPWLMEVPYVLAEDVADSDGKVDISDDDDGNDIMREVVDQATKPVRDPPVVVETVQETIPESDPEPETKVIPDAVPEIPTDPDTTSTTANVVADTATKSESKLAAFITRIKAQPPAFVTKCKSMVSRVRNLSSSELKKVAAAILGIWGVAVGVGWVTTSFATSSSSSTLSSPPPSSPTSSPASKFKIGKK